MTPSGGRKVVKLLSGLIIGFIIGVLVSTLVTFGIMSKNNEITAIKSGGVSLFRVAMPIVFIAVVISVLSYLMLDFVLPYSNQRVEQLKNTNAPEQFKAIAGGLAKLNSSEAATAASRAYPGPRAAGCRGA